jgi:hypothetical protein
MIREQNIEAIRKACIAKQSKLTEIVHWKRPIRLADVLLAAIECDLEKIYPNEKFPFTKVSATIVALWNLRKDDLTHQSDETLSFIASLLV